MIDRRSLFVNRDAAREQGNRIIAALELHQPGAARRLAADPLGELSGWASLQVVDVPAADTDSGCSVAGAYISGVDPPALTVAANAGAPRRAFTVLHELGHHLQQNNYDLMAGFAALPDGGRALEDAACDAFAADVLLPTDLVEGHLGDGLTAPAVARLWRAQPHASRAAACVAAAQRLASPGHILLVNGNGTVLFSAAHLLPPVARGSDQADTPVLAAALHTHSPVAHGMTRVRYRDGIQGQQLYAQTADIGGYLVLVAVAEHAAWETRFHLPAVDDGPQGHDWICEQCGHEHITFAARCPRCQAPPCTDCGRCNCTPSPRERTCTRCHLLQPLGAFLGDSPHCRDCA